MIMIEKDRDVSKLSREEAAEWIKTRCKNCDIQLYCNGRDSGECNKKVDSLVNKYKKNCKEKLYKSVIP